jgi:hypothetical protein
MRHRSVIKTSSCVPWSKRLAYFEAGTMRTLKQSSCVLLSRHHGYLEAVIMRTFKQAPCVLLSRHHAYFEAGTMRNRNALFWCYSRVPFDRCCYCVSNICRMRNILSIVGNRRVRFSNENVVEPNKTKRPYSAVNLRQSCLYVDLGVSYINNDIGTACTHIRNFLLRITHSAEVSLFALYIPVHSYLLTYLLTY